jgi:hypothetical protein
LEARPGYRADTIGLSHSEPEHERSVLQEKIKIANPLTLVVVWF